MVRKFIKNASYVILANGICVFISILINFMIPVWFGESTYAYYQLENLYCGYLWIITLGWHEGIYLYYGGKRDEEIDKNELITQFWMFTLYLSVMSTLIIIISGYIFFDYAKRCVFIFSICSILLEAIRYIFLYYLVCINAMKKYASYILLDRVLYIILVCIILILHKTNYKFLIGVDILSKLIHLIFIILYNKKIFFQSLSPSKYGILYAKKLILSGINITFSSFVSRMIIGTVRFAIEAYWGILVFGKISLTLSISNMFTQFVQSISVVLFPVLRRIDVKKIEFTYSLLSDILDLVMFSLFMLYLPGSKILNLILPQYSEGLRYMAILLPISLFDARNIILNITYMKTLHKEKGIFLSSFIATICSFIFTFFSVKVMHNLDVAVISMVILSALRDVCLEYILSKTIHVSLYKNFMSEWLLTIIFILCNWYISGIYGTLIYLLFLIIYFCKKRNSIQTLFCLIKYQLTNFGHF